MRNRTVCSRRAVLGALAGAAAGTAAAALWSRVGRAAEAVAAAATASKKPLNFVFILMDDLGQRDLACYGSTFYETPNIDRLAAQGMRFTDAYAACPVCSPTRASIMTGRYPPRVNITNFIAGMRSGKLIPPPYSRQLALEEVTLGEAFKEAGYTTAFMGKWHLGGEQYYPDKQGFDVLAGVAGGTTYFSPYNKALKLPDAPPGEYITDRLTDEAVKFIGATKDRPFLLMLSHYAVHVPLQAKKDLIEKYTKKAESLAPPAGPKFLPEGKNEARQVQDHAVYAAMIESADQSVGRVMKALEDAGVADRTVVIFMSDNGGLSTAEGSPTSNVPLRAGKGWLYEGGIREPLIIKWPGVTTPGSTCSVPVISTDFFPTMLEMAGLPLRPKDHCDGTTIVPLLRGGQSLQRRAIFWHYPHYSNQGGPPCGAVRAGDLKLIEFYEDDHVELYNLKEDIGEKNNLAAAMPDKAAELRAMLHAWRNEVGALMPTPAQAGASPGAEPASAR